MSKRVTVADIDALLPQTQCGLCHYSGCQPYATAILAGEANIDRCPPGGVATLQALADILEKDAQPLVDKVEQQHKSESVALIHEAECIGCTKCLQVCPTDAIIGASKQMHTVISDACTGCDLCIPVCPVDCIESVPITQRTDSEKRAQANVWRQRYQRRQQRLQKQAQHQCQVAQQLPEPIEKRQELIQAAVQRAKAKKA